MSTAKRTITIHTSVSKRTNGTERHGIRNGEDSTTTRSDRGVK
jgi:hypothetical protein